MSPAIYPAMSDAKHDRAFEADVVIVGAGPVGMTIASYLGLYGVRTLLLEQAAHLIDYPRGVGMDDECLRTFQAIGVVDGVLPHTTPNHWMRFLTASGRCFASIEPRTDEFGWPRRNAFIQPLVDAVLHRGLDRFPGVTIRFGQTLKGFVQDEDGVDLSVEDADGSHRTIRARFLVGCDGGRSTVRKTLGIAFDGRTEATRWLVVDIADDPLGTPYLYLHCDPARPYVSISLPHGIRRFEFMVKDDETEEGITAPESLNRLLGTVLERPEAVNLIRSRVYTHHARLAGRFQEGRAFLAGDAAHLMPVWQGQGYNSGIRDATNLAWKLAAVVNGHAAPDLLRTYDRERRDHAAAMIALSETAGRVFSPTSRLAAGLRDAVMLSLNALPPVKRYLLQMRFKPLPRYAEGVIVADGPLGGTSPVGRLFIQPRVMVAGVPKRLDDVLEPWFAVLSWGMDPRRWMDADDRAFWSGLGARFVVARPMTQLAKEAGDADDTIVVGDSDGRLQDWYGAQPGSILFLRPDRFVAALTTPQSVSRATKAFAEVLKYRRPEMTANAGAPLAAA